MHCASRIPRRGFTLIELLVVIAIIAVLAAILFPVFAQARKMAQQTACTNNLKQIGHAVAMYREEFGHYVPEEAGGREWMGAAPGTVGLIDPYLKSEGVRRCPARRNPNARYAINDWEGTHFGRTETTPAGRPDSAVPHPAGTLIIWEHQVTAASCDTGQNGGTPDQPDPAAATSHWDSAHLDGFVTLWCDGHVKKMSYTQLRRRFFTIEADPD